jgi:ubiquinone/menaquinone biosynthesis C-methylase UbiE
MSDSYQRFSRVVENYIHYRPRYPQALAAFLAEECGLSSNHIIADIGSGTGLLTEVFLKNGNLVYGIEPNSEMRQAAEVQLKDYANFRSMDATAEETKLADKSIHFITAGQAFHWFKHDLARIEFERILVPAGWVVLVWNLPRYNSSPFDIAFNEIWQKYIEFRTASAESDKVPDEITNFFAPKAIKIKSLDNYQICDFDALKGRVLSSSYSPDENNERYAPLIAELESLFERFQENGKVRLSYDTRIIYGQLS